MPKILAYCHAYVPDHNAGAETTLHDILSYLVKAGWEADVVLKPTSAIIADSKKREYSVNGVNVHQGDKRTILHYLPRADLTISHLECSERTHILSEAYKIPSIHLVHNTHKLTKGWMQRADGLIVNTEWITREEGFRDSKIPKIVLNPPVNPDNYSTTRGKSITLVNLWENKGSAVFYELARRFPELPFLGVKGGYGVQDIVDLPNVRIMEHTDDMKKVYGETKVILMPSIYESFGRVGVEAMASGIPTIAHPTPGLRESLGTAGIFADRDNVDEWESTLRDLLKPAKYGKQSKLSLARSKELADQRTHQLEMTEQFCNELIRIGKR